MFWGANVKQSQHYTFNENAGKLLHISNMSLGNNADEGKIYVNFQNSNKESFVLGCLNNNHCESMQTDLYIKIVKGMSLFLTGGTGKAQVSVTGFWEGSDDASESEEAVVPTKNGKQERKASIDKVEKVEKVEKAPRKESTQSNDSKSNGRKSSVFAIVGLG